MPFAFVAPPNRRPFALFSDEDYARQRAFFAARPHLAPTPLRRLPALAARLGVGEFYVKDETARFGLNAFKAAGATFAIAALRDDGVLQRGETLVCASEGNHGRAVARAAREAGCSARVYVSVHVAAARVAAIEGEGAAVVRVDGSYDDALRVMAHDAAQQGWRVISDTALEDEPVDVPRLIMLGYTRLMDEMAAQAEGALPDLVIVPGGVGGLLAAVCDWVRTQPERERPRVVTVEPVSAACLQISAREGRPTTVAGPFATVMGGLRCGEVSRAGFDAVYAGAAAYVAIEDSWALDAIRQLARPHGRDPAIEAGPSGAAALGALRALLEEPSLGNVRDALTLGPASRIVALVTEGPTDPQLFATAVGRPKNEH